MALEEGESVVVGGDINIPMIDGPALTREFVDYVMSGAGDEFLEAHKPSASSWYDAIEDAYGDTPHGNYLPRDAGNVGLEDF